MVLYQPVWLLLLIPLGAVWFIWRLPTLFLRILRAIIFLLLVLAICQPVFRLPDRSGTVVVIADRSESMPLQVDTIQKEIIDILHSSIQTRDNLAVISFGRNAVIEHPPQTAKFTGFLMDVDKDQSNLTTALEKGLSLIPQNGSGRVLLISDGRWTGKNPSEIIPKFSARRVAIDYRFIQRPSIHDVAIYSIQAPEVVSPGQAYIITFWVKSPISQEVTYKISRGRYILSTGTKMVQAGLNRIMFRDRAPESSSCTYNIEVFGKGEDPVLENNTARTIVGVREKRPILCVTSSGIDSRLVRVLKGAGLNVKASAPGEIRWDMVELAQYSAVIIEDVLADRIGREGMENISAWVENAGGGLMMTGGKHAYGQGGYFRSPLDRIMPVSMELRKEHRKLLLAIAIAMDRSGSMAVPAGGGKTKMDLANLGAVQVLDLLSSMDEFGVIAVDSSAHVIVELDKVEKNHRFRNKILQIDSMGGGIFIYEALSSACKMLLSSKATTRHVILFADAADSEEPGEYKQLLEKAMQANITVSVIGLGTHQDSDANLLLDIADRGGGLCYFTSDASEIPRLFAQDTFTVARSTFIEEPAEVRFTKGLISVTDIPFELPPPVGGYNLCYAKQGTNVSALTVDEYKAPILTSWYVGNGRVLCYTGEADGQWTGPFAQWKYAGSLFASLAKWTQGDLYNLTKDMLITQGVQDGLYLLEMHLDPERKDIPFSGEPKVRILRGKPGTKPLVETHTLKWKDADSLSLETPIHGIETLLATVEVPGHGNVTLIPVCLPYSPEFRPDETSGGHSTLEYLARSTGGKERLDIAGIWKDLPKKGRYVELTPFLLIAALVCFLSEIFQRRTALLSIRYKAVKLNLTPGSHRKKNEKSSGGNSTITAMWLVRKRAMPSKDHRRNWPRS